MEGELATVNKRKDALEETVKRQRDKIRNATKKMKRQDSALAEAQDSEENTEVSYLERKLTNEQHRVYYYQKQLSVKDENMRELECSLAEVRRLLSAAQSEISSLEAGLMDAHEETEYCDTDVKTMDVGKYRDAVRECCLGLLAMNVGVRHVGPVIRTVLKMVGKSADPLPSAGLLSKMLVVVELKQISSMQVGESLMEASSTTLHSDGTSKGGFKFGSHQVARTATEVLTLGIVNMKCGSADHVLDKLKQVLGDVASACSGDGKEQIAEILKGITNTMSDRCIVQKKFNELLQEYRADVLPSVVGGWEDLTSEQQSKLTTMNNYFCGLHYIFGLADQAQERLKKWEEVHFEGKAFGATELPRAFDTTESRVIRMLCTTANAFEKHGNEQAGCMADFNVYMEETGIPVPLAELRGNRSYVCFYNGAGVSYLRETLLQ